MSLFLDKRAQQLLSRKVTKPYQQQYYSFCLLLHIVNSTLKQLSLFLLVKRTVGSQIFSTCFTVLIVLSSLLSLQCKMLTVAEYFTDKTMRLCLVSHHVSHLSEWCEKLLLWSCVIQADDQSEESELIGGSRSPQPGFSDRFLSVWYMFQYETRVCAWETGWGSQVSLSLMKRAGTQPVWFCPPPGWWCPGAATVDKSQECLVDNSRMRLSLIHVLQCCWCWHENDDDPGDEDL